MRLLFLILLLGSSVANASGWRECTGSWQCSLSCNGPEGPHGKHWWCRTAGFGSGQPSPGHLGAYYKTDVMTLTTTDWDHYGGKIIKNNMTTIVNSCVANGLRPEDVSEVSISFLSGYQSCRNCFENYGGVIGQTKCFPLTVDDRVP